MKLSLALLMFILVAMFSCDSNDNMNETTITAIDSIKVDYLDGQCLDEFNKIFNQMTFANEVFQFDSVYSHKSNLKEGFYSEEDLKYMSFFTLFSRAAKIVVAIADYNDGQNHHEMFFTTKHKNEYYIDEGSSVICNVSFLNDCGIKISQRTRQDSILFYANLRNSAMEAVWLVDSCDGFEKFSQLVIAEKGIIIDDTLRFKYNLYENDLQMSDTSLLNLRKIAISKKRLILEDTNEPRTYYYLKKN